ncbi:MAG: hypothetical protein ACUZ8E_06060 [Candidatus Anammoxibacter sp.]
MDGGKKETCTNNILGKGKDMDDNMDDVTDELHTAAGATGDGSEKNELMKTETVALDTYEGPVGIDIGTSRIVEYRKDGIQFTKKKQLNAFFTVPFSSLTKNMLQQNNLHFKEDGDTLIIMGDGAANFANIANGEVGRPMASGIMNPSEKDGPTIMESIIGVVVAKPKNLGERLCFSIPAQTRGSFMNIVFHEKMIKNFFVSMGYIANSADEGYLVALSGLEKDGFTGIGISCGAGLCNVCLSYLSVPVFSFSIPKAGDYIDNSVARVVGERANRVRVIKEEELNLVKEPHTRIEKALHIYYDEVIMTLVHGIKTAMEESDRLPKTDNSLPIVLSGGTSMPEGFREKFENCVLENEFPVKISEIRVTEDPLNAVARGAYIAACMEYEPD